MFNIKRAFAALSVNIGFAEVSAIIKWLADILITAEISRFHFIVLKQEIWLYFAIVAYSFQATFIGVVGR